MTDSNQVNEATIERTKRRVAKMREPDLLDWAEAALPGMMRHLESYRRSGDVAHLMELGFSEMQFAIVLNELMDDHGARAEEGLT